MTLVEKLKTLNNKRTPGPWNGYRTGIQYAGGYSIAAELAVEDRDFIVAMENNFDTIFRILSIVENCKKDNTLTPMEMNDLRILANVLKVER